MMARRWLPVALFLLALGVRLHAIDQQSLWHDEGNSLRLAERTVPDLVEATSRDIHPPAYYIALKGWTSLVGTTEFGLRSLSAWWGVLAVAGTWALGKRLFGIYPATVAALLVALHPFAVYYSQEARMYAQLSALSVLSLWLLVKMLDAAPQYQDLRPTKFSPMANWAFTLALVNALGLYTQYTFAFTILAQLLLFGWWWLKHRQEHALIVVGAQYLMAWLLFQPWAYTAYQQVTTWPATGDTTTSTERLETMLTILFYGQTVATVTWLGWLVPLGLAGVAYIYGLRTASSRWAIALPSLLILISLGGLLFSGAYRATNLKFLLPAQIATALILGYGLWKLTELVPSKYGRWGISLILVGGLAYQHVRQLDILYNDTAFARSDYRAIAQTIDTLAQPTDAVILNAPNQAEVFSYYYRGDTPIYGLPAGLGGDDAATTAATRQVIANHRRIFLVLWGEEERDPNNVVQTILNQETFFVSHQWYTDVQLVQYVVLGDTPTSPADSTDILFGDDLRLVGYSLSQREFSAGADDVLGVTLFWENDEPLASAYKVSVQLLYEDGRLAAQGQDSTLNPAALSQQDRQAIVLTNSLPSGDYMLIVSVYAADNPTQRLVPQQNATEAAALMLDTIRLID